MSIINGFIPLPNWYITGGFTLKLTHRERVLYFTIGVLRRSPAVNKALRGILCSFTGLLLMSAIKFGIDVPWDIARIFLIVASFISLLLKVDIPWIVLAGSAISIFIL